MTDNRRHFGGAFSHARPLSIRYADVPSVPLEPAPADKRAGAGMRLWEDDVDERLRAASDAAGVHYEPLDEALYGDGMLDAVDIEGDYWKDEAGNWHRFGDASVSRSTNTALNETYRGANGADVRYAGGADDATVRYTGGATRSRVVTWDWSKPEWVFTCEKCHTQIRTRAAWKDALADARKVGWQAGRTRETLCPAHVKLKGGAK